MEIYKHKDLDTFDLSVNLPLGQVEIEYDTTDHFWFVCHQCEEDCEVLQVEGADLDGDLPCLYFLLMCPTCKRVGNRKVYMKTWEQMSRKDDSLP